MKNFVKNAEFSVQRGPLLMLYIVPFFKNFLKKGFAKKNHGKSLNEV